MLEMTVRDFLKNPKWSVNAHLDKIPVQDVLPISSRMGLTLPESLNISGTLGGVVDYVGGVGSEWPHPDGEPGWRPCPACFRCGRKGDRHHLGRTLSDLIRLAWRLPTAC